MREKGSGDEGVTWEAKNAGYAPYLDYQPLKEEDLALVEPVLEQSWLRSDIESQAAGYAIAHLVPQHLQEVKRHKEELIDKTLAAVKDRLTKEITPFALKEYVLR